MEKKTVSARVWENGAASRSDCGCKQYVWDIGLYKLYKLAIVDTRQPQFPYNNIQLNWKETIPRYWNTYFILWKMKKKLIWRIWNITFNMCNSEGRRAFCLSVWTERVYWSIRTECSDFKHPPFHRRKDRKKNGRNSKGNDKVCNVVNYKKQNSKKRPMLPSSIISDACAFLRFIFFYCC